MSNNLHLAVIYGSDREGRFCDTVVNWLAGQLERSGYKRVRFIDPADKATDTHTILDAADAFIVVTPEYNHGYPAPLKAIIDSAKAEWQAKPLGFVSYGGVSGGARAVEQLLQVFAELHTVTLRDSVSFINAWEQFDDSGCLREPARAERSLARMLAHLRWWALALRKAREETPYEEILA
ncbi:NADPH-dependent FMN reductase [Microbulbifer thermotolerans]|uniref:NADPH-dependent FMN reductase n=1 Tax=Microbulbifer thermotolerans TaxID=252514 RepID=UPI00224B480E|nr:NAD(P)H-dependent oxidoreductase [Microbulbifer thermotolerans]MCX2781248.1 NAD(P)H-dependent oxidoreductase [Microbulbifer thermotolerans]MCX2803723.1 NAD(P)H-dependent oxidoreductase [Microbulbifer thermotolerans]